jgi:hypothetical protein
MAAKRPSIASLVREAGESEAGFVQSLGTVLKEKDTDRFVEFATRLNQPLRMEGTDEEVPGIDTLDIVVTDFETETIYASALNKFNARHMRKIKWHISHPDIDTVEPGIRIYCCIARIAELRLRRMVALLNSKEVLNPIEWGLARELMNCAYREFRDSSELVTQTWFEALFENFEQDEVRQRFSAVPDVLDGWAERLSALRDEVETRRVEMAVQPPEPYPVVRPPRYFGGDLMAQAAWKHYWGEVGTLADSLRQHVEF